MKNLLTFVLSLFVSTILFAQNPRIEKFDDYRIETYHFQNGKGDSVQYKLRDKADMLQETLYYRSGKVSSILWQDSFYFFDLKGRLRVRKIGLKIERIGCHIGTDKEYYKTIVYYPNGQYQYIITDKNGQYFEQRFNENGQVVSTKSRSNTPSVYWERVTFKNGKTRFSHKIDTLIKDYVRILNFHDTVFYKNGQIYSILSKQEMNGRNINILSEKYYKLDGTLIASELPDSVKLTPFKDNVDCYYGLKNRRGDTIFKPQFDQIKIDNSNNFIKAFVGDRCTLLHLDGSPMKVPINNLIDVEELYAQSDETDIPILDDENADAYELNYILAPRQNKFFRFTTVDKQYGVMTKAGEIIIPPQYLYPLNYNDKAHCFSLTTLKGSSAIRIGCMDMKGKTLFPDKFKYVVYSGFEDYFIISSQFEESNRSMREDYRPTLAGLSRGNDETVLIEPQFEDIKLLKQSSLFSVTLKRPGDKHTFSEPINGLYDAHSKKWLLEAKDYTILNDDVYRKNVYFVLKNIKTQKYCIMDAKGKYLITPSLSVDSIGIIDDVNGLFWVKTKGKYYFLDIKNGQASMHSKGYEFLCKKVAGQRIGNNFDNSMDFLAKQNGKWGLIESNENILIPFEYDYASSNIYSSLYESGFFMVKNNIASLFDDESIPRERPIFSESIKGDKKALVSYALADNPQTLFFINDTGKVIIPPQYKKINDYHKGEYILVQDAEKHKKIIFEETGEVIDKPLKYNIALAHTKSRILLMKDSTEISYGIVRKDGTELMPCINYGVALGDIETSTFFVKRDTPLVQRVQESEDYYDEISLKNDSLNIEDNNWFLYDAEGQLLNKQPFRFPFDFNKGIGIGVQGEDFNLYKTDGTIYPPQYKNLKTAVPKGFNNIVRIEPNNYYALFRNQGLVPTMMVTNAQGQIFVDEGRYDGISRFYGKYALVSASGKIGLIDTLGQEIIAPQDLRTSSIALIDSINLGKRFLHSFRSIGDNEYSTENFPRINTGQFVLTTEYLKINDQQRTSLINLMLEERLSNIISNAQDMQIERSPFVAKADFIKTYSKEINTYLNIEQLAVTDKFISFAYKGFRFNLEPSHNFQKINNRWEKRTLYDFIDLRDKKREQLNGLMTQKIRALKDVTINCSNSDFLKQVENRFILTEQGIDFCFESAESNSQLVIVSFTWDELKPFLK